MFTVISRILQYGFKNFIRSGLLSTATVAIVTLSLLVFAGLLFANAATDAAVSFLQDKIDVSAYFQVDAPEDDILRVKASLEELSEVKQVRYTSAEEALDIFRQRHADDEAIVQSLEELNENPLQPSLNIKAHDPGQYERIAAYLENDVSSEHLDSVSYAENQVVIDRLVGLIGGVNRIGFAITLVLSFIAGLVVFNTIRIVIYSNREEISIMRVVGASNALVRGPYVVEGTIIGFLSAVLSSLIILLALVAGPVVYQTGSYFSVSVPGFSFADYFYANFLSLFLYQVIFGIALTGISSFIAVRRYLKR